MRIVGLDPGLRRTGWGVIDAPSGRLRYVAHGTVDSDGDASLPERLRQLYDGLSAVLALHRPDEAAVEETFVNRNPVSTLKLGQARGIALLVPALAGLPVAEYLPNRVKQAVVGYGHADKVQVQAMVGRLLPGAAAAAGSVAADAADALALAICHAHYAATARRIAAARPVGAAS